MRRLGYLVRTLRYHAPRHLAVVLGVMVGTATLTGALLVGDSMRGSLRATALARLGGAEYALNSGRFFRAEVANELAQAVTHTGADLELYPAIILRGGAVHADTHARAGKVTVIGIDQRFWELAAPVDSDAAISDGPQLPAGRSVLLNQRLAEQLGARVGDDVLLRLGKIAAVSPETLLGRRDDPALTLRLTVRGIVPPDAGGGFALRQQQAAPANAWVALGLLQRMLDQPGRINTLLVAGGRADNEAPRTTATDLNARLSSALTLADLGLRLRPDEQRGYLALESESVLLDPVIERAALQQSLFLPTEPRASARADSPVSKHTEHSRAHPGRSETRVSSTENGEPTATPVLTYLANSIERIAPVPDESPGESNDKTRASIPYSTVSALGAQAQETQPFTLPDGTPAPPLQAGDLLLNAWAAEDLVVRVGDRITLTYYVTGRFGQLETQRSDFALRGIVRMDNRAADPGFTPPYRGVTDTKSLSEWDPPFPVDLSRVTERDEEYWDRYRAAPKAFVSLADGRRMWVERDARFGRSTSIRVYPPAGADLAETGQTFTRNLMQRLDPAQLGFAFEPVRAQALAASTGTTDFGTLFISFSFFLIAAAALLVALLFRLGAERRAAEVGLLLATGFQPATVTRLLVAEGAVVATVGGLLGLSAALLYAGLMLAGLRSWWSGAVNAPFLSLHVSLTTFVIGFSASLIIALVSMAWSIRRLAHLPPHDLMAGATSADRYVPPQGSRRAFVICAAGFTAALLLAFMPAFSDSVPATPSFFVGGGGPGSSLSGIAQPLATGSAAYPFAKRRAALAVETGGTQRHPSSR